MRTETGDTQPEVMADEKDQAGTAQQPEVLPSDVVALFRSLLDDDYYKDLKARLRAGVAGPVEILVLKYAHGEPKIHHRVKDDQKRFQDLVKAMKKLKTENPDQAKFLDAQVQALGAVDAEVSDADADE